LAAITWQLMFLPLLIVAACAAFQVDLFAKGRRVVGSLAALALLAGYGLLVWPTVAAAWTGGELVPLLLLVAPALLALTVAGPLVPGLVRPVGVLTHVMLAGFLIWAAFPFVTTPVLPLNVIVAEFPDATAPAYIRGNVISVDDVNTVILKERGGVQYVPDGVIREQYLCPNAEDVPRYRLRIHGLRLEDSALRAIGRNVRPLTPVNPACRAAPDPHP
jgi:hypothetical protein